MEKTKLISSEDTREFWKAYFDAQVEFSAGIKAHKDNPFHKSKYAKLSTVVAAATPILQKHGMAFFQYPEPMTEAGQPIVTRVIHVKSDQFVESKLVIPVLKPDAQKVGSAVTYACRYSLLCMLGMPPHEDDDGAVASDKVQKSAYRARKDGDWEKLKAEMEACSTPDELRQWGMASRDAMSKLPDNWQTMARDEYERIMGDLNMRHKEG